MTDHDHRPLHPTRVRLVRGALLAAGLLLGASLPVLEASAGKSKPSKAAVSCELQQMELILDTTMPCLLYTPPGQSTPVDLWEGTYEYQWPSDGSGVELRVRSARGKVVSGTIVGPLEKPIVLRWDGTAAVATIPPRTGREVLFELELDESEPVKKLATKPNKPGIYMPKPKLTLKPVEECPPVGKSIKTKKGKGKGKKKKPKQPKLSAG